MFAIILTFVLFTTYVTAEIPSYIQVCNRRDPNIDQCIINNTNNLRNKLCEGILEMEVPPLKLIHLPDLILSETNNIKLYIRELEATGVCDYIINDIHLDLDKMTLDFNVTLKDMYFNSTYDFDIRIMIAIMSKGRLSFTTDNINYNFHCDLKMATKDHKKYIYVSKVTSSLDIKGFKTQFENSNSNQLQEIIANFIGNNEKEILKTFTPALEKAVSEFLLLTANNILKQFPFDELFPDRT